jgi:hypothetical protein
MVAADLESPTLSQRGHDKNSPVHSWHSWPMDFFFWVEECSMQIWYVYGSRYTVHWLNSISEPNCQVGYF